MKRNERLSLKSSPERLKQSDFFGSARNRPTSLPRSQSTHSFWIRTSLPSRKPSRGMKVKATSFLRFLKLLRRYPKTKPVHAGSNPTGDGILSNNGFRIASQRINGAGKVLSISPSSLRDL